MKTIPFTIASKKKSNKKQPFHILMFKPNCKHFPKNCNLPWPKILQRILDDLIPFKTHQISQGMVTHTAIPVCGWLKQMGQRFDTSLDYRVRPCLKQNKIKSIKLIFQTLKITGQV
jgi:hypothetical protein